MTNLESFYEFLNESSCNELNLTFEQLKSILGDLPDESRFRNWWSNDSSNEYSKTWCSAGYDVTKVVPDCYVRFSKIDKINRIGNNPTATTKKATNYAGYHFLGGVLMVLDLVICIPLLLGNFDKSFFPILFIGGVVFFISLILVCIGYSGSNDSIYSSNNYEQSLNNEMKYHNTKNKK